MSKQSETHDYDAACDMAAMYQAENAKYMRQAEIAERNVNNWIAVASAAIASDLAISEKLAAAQAEIAALREDAERYRWLRTQHWSHSNLCVVAQPKKAVKLGHECPSQERLDAAIDAARKEQQ